MSQKDLNKNEEFEKTMKQLEMLKKKYDGDSPTDLSHGDIKKAIEALEKKFAAQAAQMESAQTESGQADNGTPVFYTADGRPVVPVYLPVDANGNPLAGFPGFPGAPAEPEEEYEELPDGTKMKIIYQDAAFKKEEQENKAKKKQQKKTDQDYFASMKVIYESADASEEPKNEDAVKTEEAKAEEKPQPEETKAEEIKPEETAPADDVKEENEEPDSLFAETSSSLVDLINEGEEPEDKKKPADGKFRRLLRNNIPWKGDSASEIIRKVVMLAAVVTLICCLGYFANLGIQEYQNSSKNNDLSNQLTPVAGDVNKLWADIKGKYPNVNFPKGMNPRFADLYARNQDLVGWLKIENTKVDFPIVQTKDNDYYLHRSFDKHETKYGNPFMDHSNSILPLNRNTVLYGHHMKTGNQVFTDLTKYRDVEQFKKTPTIQFSTLYADYTWKIYGVFLTNSRPSDDNGYVFNYIFKDLNSDESFMKYMQAIDERKLYDTGVDIKPTDKILTLSTCEYDFEEARLVVVARLVRPGEDKSVDVSKARVNVNPRYPQAYYDKKGVENPFKNAGRWTPAS